MTAADWVPSLLEYIVALRDSDEAAAGSIVEAAADRAAEPHFASLLRMGILQGGASPKHYRKLRNVWLRTGRPHLKRVQTPVSLEIMSDGTVDALKPHLELFLAAYGVAAEITIATFDSVEHEALVADSKSFDCTVVVLSEQWVRRFLPVVTVSSVELDSLSKRVRAIVAGLRDRRSGSLVFTSFHAGAWRVPGSRAAMGDMIPFGLALERLNDVLFELAGDDLLVIDTQSTMHGAGGVSSIGRRTLTRMHAPFEESGFVALAREIASVLAHHVGRSHRALLTDWDNTLWGGEVGELGFQGIRCGHETSDGYGYYLLQQYMRDLSALGVLIAGVSRNDPRMADVLDENPHLALRRDHFASLALSWGDKSQSVTRIVEELNFGADLMVYIDDNHVDLVEVLIAHPEIDVVLAGPEADQSLDRLALGRYFNVARLTSSDLKRSAQAVILREQRTTLQDTGSKEEFLASLAIRLAISGINDVNRERVLQLLQKTNQFNLTTRRHKIEAIEQILGQGGKVGVFDYADRFGAQGIIGLMILVPAAEGAFEIDTWLMSCRVLHRGVEQSMLDWAQAQVADGTLFGTYLPTEKNGLVSELYPNLGFTAVSEGRFALHVDRKHT